jgi:hypothetical protein
MQSCRIMFAASKILKMKKHWILLTAAALFIVGVILWATQGNLFGWNILSSGSYATGYFASGIFAAGVFSAGIFSFGIFSIGVFSIGIFSLGIFNIGWFALGFFLLGKKGQCDQLPERANG